jgi:S1-C subfamily serine protease
MTESQRSSPPDSPASSGSAPVPVIVYLSGSARGTTLRLSGDALRIGTAVTAEIRIPADPSSVVREEHAVLVRRGASYSILARPGSSVWVNGEPIEELVLASGDVLEIGRGGPVLRFRLYPPGSRGFKSIAEVFADCVDCARHASTNAVGKAAIFVAGAPRELATQTAPWFRGIVVLLLAALALSILTLTVRSRRLERSLALESERVRGIAELLDHSESGFLTAEDLAAVRTEVADQLTDANRRLEALEARSEAATRVIAAAAEAVVFLQGSYGLVEPESGKPLRFRGIGPDGRPLLNRQGQPEVTLDGDGPPVESLYTGTAFVASEDGLLVTNRHVAVPWDYESSIRALTAQGLVPVMRRFVGYLPGFEEPFDVELVVASDAADVAVLRCRGVTGRVPSLEFAPEPPEPGDEVVVLGYPTGMRALLARTDPAVIERILEGQELDFWAVARRLAKGGHIGPLASRGIVGQVTPAAVVYDAETTQGGSGGPVLALNGRVVAVNAAILPEFGGSNLGVPALHGLKLMELTRGD